MLVSPSGCGKSTALQMIVGPEDVSGGDMVIGGKRMTDIKTTVLSGSQRQHINTTFTYVPHD